jgi:hypothetical protein
MLSLVYGREGGVREMGQPRRGIVCPHLIHPCARRRAGGHGSYLGISCRQRRPCTTVDNDPTLGSPAFRTRSAVLVAVIPGPLPLTHSEGLHDVRPLGGRRVATGDSAPVVLCFLKASPTAKVCRLRVIGPRGEIRSATQRILSVTTWMRRKPSAWGVWDIVKVDLG